MKNKKTLLKTLSFLPLLSLPLIFVNNIKTANDANDKNLNENNNLDLLNNKAAPTSLENQYAYQDNYFSPMISEDGSAISLNSTKTFVSLSTAEGFLNWQNDIRNHPDLTGEGQHYTVVNGIIANDNEGARLEQYIFIAFDERSTATSFKVKLIKYNHIGEPIANTNNSGTFTLKSAADNTGKKIAIVKNKHSNLIYMFIPGLISDFKGSINIFTNLNNTFAINTVDTSGWSNNADSRLKDENKVLAIVLPAEQYAVANRVYLILNTTELVSGNNNNRLSFVPISSNDFKMLANTLYTMNDDINTARINPIGSGRSQSFSASINSRSLFDKMLPISYFNTDIPSDLQSFIYTIETDNKIFTTKFWGGVGSDYSNLNKKQENAGGYSPTIESNASTTKPFLRSVISQYDGRVNLLIYGGTSGGNEIYLNNIQRWGINSFATELHYLFLSEIVQNSDLKSANKLSSIFILPTIFPTSWTSLRVYYTTNTNVNRIGTSNDIYGLPTTFDGTLSKAVPNQYVWFDNDFQKRAVDLRWTGNTANSKLPSQIEESITIGNSATTNFFATPPGKTLGDVGIPANISSEYTNVNINDSLGTFKANSTLSFYNQMYRKVTNLYYNVSLNDLKTNSTETNFEINNTQLSQFMPSEINDTNVDLITTISNLPLDTTKIYDYKNRNNLNGTLTIELVVSKHYDNSGTLVPSSKTFTLNITNMKKTLPTDIKINLPPSSELSTLTTYDISDTLALGWITIENPMNNTLPEITLSNARPLDGTLTVKAEIWEWYNSAGVPTTGTTPGFSKTFDVTGLKKVTQTIVTAKNGAPDKYVAEIVALNIDEYIDIKNRVPGSELTATIVRRYDGIDEVESPYVIFKYKLSEIYNEVGAIVPGVDTEIKISGFKRGDGSGITRLVKISDGNVVLFPFQITTENIGNYVELINDTTPASNKTWSLQYNNYNKDSTTGGQLTIGLTVDRFIDESSNQVDRETTFNMTISSFKSVTGPTTISAINNGSPNVYASDISNDENKVAYKRYLNIANGSGIDSELGTEAVLSGNDPLKFDNRQGSLQITYRLKNYFTVNTSGVGIWQPNESTERTITIRNFKTVAGATELNIINSNLVSDILPTDFEMTPITFNNFFKLDNRVGPNTIFNPQEVKIIDANNAKGEITLEYKIYGNYYNRDLVVANAGQDGIVVTQIIKGFRIETVNPIQDNLIIIIGASVGGLLLIIAIIATIILIKKSQSKRNAENLRKQKLDQKGPGTPKPGSPIGTGGPATPQGKPPVGPSTNRMAGPLPPPPISGRPMPPRPMNK